MRLNQISDNPGATKTSKRIGRGIGSGKGKTGGRGVKGQKSRAGVAIHGYEGGQMPLHRRLPKRGFKSLNRKDYVSINVGRLQAAVDAGKLKAGAVDGAALVAAGVITHLRDGFRLLAKGEISAALEITANGASKAAIDAVEKAGGKVHIVAGATPTDGAE
jgi:large subunit ribosomal protein L15